MQERMVTMTLRVPAHFLVDDPVGTLRECEMLIQRLAIAAIRDLHAEADGEALSARTPADAPSPPGAGSAKPPATSSTQVSGNKAQMGSGNKASYDDTPTAATIAEWTIMVGQDVALRLERPQ